MRTVHYTIECPARCKERGCTDEHLPDGWRVSKTLHAGSQDEAEATLIAYADKYWASGPYRLREHVEIHEETHGVVMHYTPEEKA